MLKRLWCSIRGHEGVPIRRLSEQATKVLCERCGGVYAYNHAERILIPWTEEVKQFYATWPELANKTDSKDQATK